MAQHTATHAVPCVLRHTLVVQHQLTTLLMSCRLVGTDAWPISPKLVSALQSVSSKLSVAMQATVSTLILPSPLGFTTVRGLGLHEGQHLAGKPIPKL